MKIERWIVLAFVLFAFSSCGPSDEDKARVKMNLVQTLLQQRDTTNALSHLDSIARFYPKAAYSINAAKNLKNEILYEKLRVRVISLEATKKRIPELEANFTSEKTAYVRYTQYIHKRQNFDNSWDRSYIRVNLDERGEISLTSNYYGQQWLDHTALKVYDKGDEALTGEVPLGSVDNHHSSFMETRWEQVTYRNEAVNGVIAFIAANTHRILKAAFLGKRTYYIVLEDYDKQAIKDALLLSETLKKKTGLENEIKALQKNLNIQQ